MTDEEAEEMIMSADGDGNGEVIIDFNKIKENNQTIYMIL